MLHHRKLKGTRIDVIQDIRMVSWCNYLKVCSSRVDENAKALTPTLRPKVGEDER